MELVDRLDELEELLKGARPVPLTGNAVVNRRRLLHLIDRIRTSLPEAVREADRIRKAQKGLLREAKEQAEALEREARQQAAEILDSSKLVREAEARSEALLKDSRQKAQAILTEAEQQAEGIYARLEDQLSQLLKLVRESSSRRR